MKSAISIKNLNFSYEQEMILKDFSLEIESGHFICLTGESGCGKSTLLHLINGLLLPQSGNITINGKALSKANMLQIRQDMGYILQDGSLFPHLNIYQNMTYCLRLQKKTKNECDARISELLPLVNLDESLLDKFPSELSGGQRQRVGIIRGIAHKPSVILLDEPFSALDPVTREDLQELVKNIHQKAKTTFVMVTHSLEEAKKLASRIVQIEKPL